MKRPALEILLAIAFIAFPLGGQFIYLTSAATATFNQTQHTMRLPRFDRRLLLETSSETSANVSIGDLDGDGNLDIVLAKGRHWPLVDHYVQIDIVVGNVKAQPTIYVNDGSGLKFTPVNFGDNQGTVYGFAIADLNRDGLPDIAVARSRAPNVVYFGSR